MIEKVEEAIEEIFAEQLFCSKKEVFILIWMSNGRFLWRSSSTRKPVSCQLTAVNRKYSTRCWLRSVGVASCTARFWHSESGTGSLHNNGAVGWVQ